MKIIYIANARIPTEKAHGIQIMKMCEAFAELKVEDEKLKVELVVPRRLNNIKENPFEYYGVKENFKIIKLPTLDLVEFGKIGFLIQSFSFALFSSFYLFFKKYDFIYSRDEFSLYFFSFFKKNLFWEAHTKRENFIVKRVFKKVNGIISITQGLKDFYVKNFRVNSNKILVVSDGVDIEKFKVESGKLKVRDRLGLPQNKKIVLYTGHLYSWKGVGTLIESTKFLDEDTLVYLVGGTEGDVLKIKKQTSENKNIIVVGSRPHSEIPYWQKSADVLVLPNTAKEDISKYYTSPMKLFEYMASGNSIVASDLPSIREVLNKDNSVLVEPDNPKKLAEGMNKVLGDFNFADKISKQALEDVKNYTWGERVKNILDFIKR